MAYYVKDFGAAGDGKTNDAAAIQKAIDTCEQQGGGKVVLEGGHTYISGSLVLKSWVELVIESGAVLKASEDLNDYQFIDDLARQGKTIWWRFPPLKTANTTESQDSISSTPRERIMCASAAPE